MMGHHNWQGGMIVSTTFEIYGIGFGVSNGIAMLDSSSLLLRFVFLFPAVFDT